MSTLPAIAALVVAAGRGTRFGGEVPKQYRMLAGKPVLAHTLAAFGAVGEVGRIFTVIHPDDAAAYGSAARASGVASARLGAAPGGESRQASARLGLEALAASGFPADGLVLIHDAARPLVAETLILRAALAAATTGAAIPVLPVADTLATLDAEGDLAGNPDRAGFRLVQTPQAFRFGLILDAHQRFARTPGFTDDASLARAAGHKVATFLGDARAFKITIEEDLARAQAMLSAVAGPDIRTGLGYDVHAFTEGDAVTLGGVKIPHDRALLGHSDADAALHALTDALLGTIGDGDIGQHFPPSDPQWKGAPSRLFLEDAARRVREAGGRILSADCMIVAEAPKLSPHRPAMKAVIAEALGISADRVGVKATTNEKLGFTGRREGIAALAIATVSFSGG